MARTVKAGREYVYWAVGMDRFDPACSAVNGQRVVVKNMHGCPQANTMGHCHIIASNSGAFLGLCLTNSLNDVPEGE